MIGRRLRVEYATLVGVPAALAVIVVAQWMEGAPARLLWQPTAALVVFGGTFAAVLISYPWAHVRRTATAVRAVCARRAEPAEQLMARLIRYSQISRRHGIPALEPELDRAEDSFLRTALALVVDGTNAKQARHILEIESDARRAHDDEPADLLETAAGYSPTLGILGAVLGLIHVMQSIGDPSRLASGISVAFVATVYGVATANLVLLPLATRIRSRARQDAVDREIVIEGMASLQEGLNPRVIDQKLRGFFLATRRDDRVRKAA